MRVGGVVLCGGQSTRMGEPKANLAFGPERMLQRVVRILAEVVKPIVVVAAPEQALPPLPGDVLLAHDPQTGQGPLRGISAGLHALTDLADAAYITSCDVPLLSAAFITRMVELLGDYEAVVPVEDKFHHPLAGVYRTWVASIADELLAAKRLRPLFLLEQVRTRRVDVSELRDIDPELLSLRNLNNPEDYREALKIAGFDW